jgi:bacterioferritin (cytochrome b1)
MPKQTETGKEMLEILSRALGVEYQMIVHYPRIARMMRDEELASKVDVLGLDSIKHADAVANAISGLGGIPPFPSIVLLPEPVDLKDFFQKQLQLEHLALNLHTRAAEGVGEQLAPSLRKLAEQEKWHIELVEEILSKLP